MIRLLEMLTRGLNRRRATKRKVGFYPIKYKKPVLNGSLAETEQLHGVHSSHKPEREVATVRWK
jgi:hypothetical protein